MPWGTPGVTGALVDISPLNVKFCIKNYIFVCCISQGRRRSARQRDHEESPLATRTTILKVRLELGPRRSPTETTLLGRHR